MVYALLSSRLDNWMAMMMAVLPLFPSELFSYRKNDLRQDSIYLNHAPLINLANDPRPNWASSNNSKCQLWKIFLCAFSPRTSWGGIFNRFCFFFLVISVLWYTTTVPAEAETQLLKSGWELKHAQDCQNVTASQWNEGGWRPPINKEVKEGSSKIEL